MRINKTEWQTRPTTYELECSYDELVALLDAAEMLKTACDKHLIAAPKTPPTIARRNELESMITVMEQFT